jgi:CRISPR-associated protein (TIGR03984 family)
MKREIQDHPAVVESITADNITDVKQWLQTQATTCGLVWLLAHADDGVIWGHMLAGQLLTSYDAAQNDNEARRICPRLRIETLQQARLFATHAELLLWRDGDNACHARLIRDAKTGESTEWDEAFEEPQLLWGTHGKHLPSDFTLLEDGAQGLRHAVPQRLSLGANREATPPRLFVRHYINKLGFTRIVASRLLDLK